MKQKLKVFSYFLVKDLKVKYSGSLLGFVWAFLLPLFNIFILWLVFSAILKSRPYANTETPYIYFMLSSFFFWLAFSDGLMRSANVIIENAEIVKRISFPIIILPATATVSSYIQYMIGFIIFMVLYTASNSFSFIYLLVIPIIALQLLFSLGIGFILSSLTPYIRDIGQLLAPIMQGAFFLCPIIYSLDAIPQNYRLLFYINPMTYFASSYHKIILSKELPEINIAAVVVILPIVVFLAGYLLFKTLKDGFADVL
ncbi:ABC-2 type transporter [Candidatus Magnetoovum chiemensis]|nr:ABC-2 type transporter [Candidatus Magnetoovum chiemensis]